MVGVLTFLLGGVVNLGGSVSVLFVVLGDVTDVGEHVVVGAGVAVAVVAVGICVGNACTYVSNIKHSSYIFVIHIF